MKCNRRSKRVVDGRDVLRTSDFNLFVGGFNPEVREPEDGIVILFLCFKRGVRGKIRVIMKV